MEIHHIRLAVGIEVNPSESGHRVLEKAHCEQMAANLAADLARIEPAVSQGLLVVGGTLLEPAEALQPGLSSWQALIDLSAPVMRQHGVAGNLLAIGAFQGKLPDARLRPPDRKPDGSFLIMPILLALPLETAQAIVDSLEDKLFEQGGVHPPARACLTQATGWTSAHAQLLTATDLIALQHVQMDTAGLGAFWPVVEHALTDEGSNRDFELPGGLTARWQADSQTVIIHFASFEQHGGNPDAYALWTRAFRSLSALADNHGVRRDIESSLVHDQRLHCLIEACGPCSHRDSLTEHLHNDCGLVAWTLVDDGHQVNLYPLNGQAIASVRDDLAMRSLPRKRSDQGICYDPSTNKLLPAA